MRPRETLHVDFLITWVKEFRGVSLHIDEGFHDEDTPTDVQVLSEKGKVFKIQNVAYRDGTFYKYGTSNVEGFKPLFVLGTAMTQDERTASIVKTIEDKKCKYTESDRQDVILLIEVTIPGIKPEDIKHLSTEIDYGFKGIYFVQLPYGMAAVDDKYGRDGYVYELIPIDWEETN